MANENQAEYIGACTLIKIEWAGTATHRYITALGYVNYDGVNWYDADGEQGQIMSVGSFTEKANEIANRDINLLQTQTIFNFVESGTWVNSRVTMIEGNIDPITNLFTAFNTSYWRLTDIPEDGGLNEIITFTMVSENLGFMLEKGNITTYSAISQIQLLGSGITDTGFRYISNLTDGSAVYLPNVPGIFVGG